MNFKNKLLSVIFFFFFIIPINAFAYSSSVVLGGKNVGIESHGSRILPSE